MSVDMSLGKFVQASHPTGDRPAHWNQTLFLLRQDCRISINLYPLFLAVALKSSTTLSRQKSADGLTAGYLALGSCVSYFSEVDGVVWSENPA